METENKEIISGDDKNWESFLWDLTNWRNNNSEAKRLLDKLCKLPPEEEQEIALCVDELLLLRRDQ